MKDTPDMLKTLSEFSAKGLLVPRRENNIYLKYSYRGSGTKIPKTWNVKVYTSGSVVCNDQLVLEQIISGSFTGPNYSLKMLQIDDSGVGFPMCGVMVGVADGRELMTAVVDVQYFREGSFEKKEYLNVYSKHARAIIRGHFHATPETHRVEICTGYINSVLKEDLRKEGFDVQVTEIKGFLQDNLEDCFREYINKTLGADLSYDPKEFSSKKTLSQQYHKVLLWGQQHRPDMLKNGWKALKNA